MIYSNDNLTIEVSEHGAELTSLRCDGREYLWNGDAAYWNRHSPVLSPWWASLTTMSCTLTERAIQ